MAFKPYNWVWTGQLLMISATNCLWRTNIKLHFLNHFSKMLQVISAFLFFMHHCFNDFWITVKQLFCNGNVGCHKRCQHVLCFLPPMHLWGLETCQGDACKKYWSYQHSICPLPYNLATLAANHSVVRHPKLLGLLQQLLHSMFQGLFHAGAWTALTTQLKLSSFRLTGLKWWLSLNYGVRLNIAPVYLNHWNRARMSSVFVLFFWARTLGTNTVILTLHIFWPWLAKYCEGFHITR